MFVDKYDKHLATVQPMSMAVRTPQVRRSNLALVLDRLRRHGPSSRSQLVQSTGLTRSAIAGLVGELESLGLVIEERSEPDGRPGRPSPVVRVDPGSVGVLAVEIFVDEIGAAVVGLDGSVIASVRRDRRRERVAVDETVHDVTTLVDDLRREIRRGRPQRIVGCGVSVPGLVRGTDGMVLAAPNLGWADVPLADLLSHAFGDLPTVVRNDADLGALAESRFGAGVDSDHLVYVSGEVGVGGGLLIAGQPVVGHAGLAGEIGHMPVNPDGKACACGSIGCWETEVGERALLARAGLDPDAGRQGVEHLLELAALGDTVALEALEVEARWLAIGIAGLVNILDLDTVVLGGLFARILSAVREPLDAELSRRQYQAAGRRVAVVGAALGSQAVTIGAAEVAFGQLLADPAGAVRLAVA
jgi:predicted NBD/HSP70 family sugar kinase